MQPGMSFYGELPDNYTLVVNTANGIVENIKKQATDALSSQLTPLILKMDDDNKLISTMRDSSKQNADAETDKKIADLEKSVADARKQQDDIIAEYAKTDSLTGQLIDLALLRRGLLTGAALDRFIDRSVSLLKCDK